MSHPTRKEESNSIKQSKKVLRKSINRNSKNKNSMNPNYKFHQN